MAGVGRSSEHTFRVQTSLEPLTEQDSVDAVVTEQDSVGAVSATITEKSALLHSLVAARRDVVVAFSGGADSALLAWVAHQALGDHALAVTAVSPSLPADELDHCRMLAETWGMAWRPVRTEELANPSYVANDGDRCYWCKAELMDVVGPAARQRNATVLLGVNVDDLGDHRPGQRAASERGAHFPLVEAGLTKADVRAMSRSFGLSTWDRPAAACLASRIPYGTPVSLRVLSRVERAEAAMRRLGFVELRVRHYGDTARIEVGEEELAHALAERQAIVLALRTAGYDYITLDLEGLRSGNLNAALDPSRET